MTLSALDATVILSRNGKPFGTGFLIHESGLLATCFHLVRRRPVQTPEAAEADIGEVLDFVTLGADGLGVTGQATVTTHFNAACDAALLQIQGKVPAALRPVRLIRGDHPAVAEVRFKLVGHAAVPDSNARYDYYSATGQIEAVIPRSQVPVLKLKSNDIHQGMSGGAIYTPDLEGVVGMQSVRLSVDPKVGWGKDTGFACLSEAIAALSPLPIALQEPIAVSAPTRIQNINAQNIQQLGINAQTVMIGELGFTESWHRPNEIKRRWQGDISRQTEIQEIRERLSAKSQLALWGLAGSGKSTLAAQYAQQHSDDYPGGILWAELGPQFDPQLGSKAILTRWADWGYGGPKQLAQLLGQKRLDILPEDVRRLFSGHGRLLIVLDDVHVGEHLAQLREALPFEADLLITMPGQQTVQDLADPPQPLAVQPLNTNDAIAFLQDRLPQLPKSLLTQLADTFDYHAHALVLIATELQKSPDPSAAARQLLERQNHDALAPIRTAFEFSYQQLPGEDEYQAFQQLGILSEVRADFGIDLAVALWDVSAATALARLETLCQRTLLAQLEDQRWAMNALISDYARDLLEAQNPALKTLTLERYQSYVFNLANRAGAWTVDQPELSHLKYVGQQLVDQLATLYAFDIESIDVESIEQPSAEILAAVTPELRSQLERTGSYIISTGQYLLQPEARGFAVQWFAALIGAGQLLGETAGTALGLFMLAHWHVSSEELARACVLFHQAHQHWQLTGDMQSAGYALSRKGYTLRLQGETQAALNTFVDALKEMDEASYEDRQLRATLLINLSQQYLIVNEYDQASYYLDLATELADGQLSEEFVAEAVQLFSILLLNQGKFEEALKRLQVARDRVVQIGNEQTLAEIDVSIGTAYLRLGDSKTATETFQQVLAQAEALTYPRLKPPALTGLAIVRCSQSEFQVASDYLKEALQLLKKYQDKSQEAQVLALLGEVTLAMNDPQKALKHLKQALPLLSAVQDTTTAVRIFDNIGSIYQQTNQISEGLEYLKQELPTIKKLKNAGAEVTILNWIALLLSDVGDISQAMVYFDQAAPIIDTLENDIERATTLTVSAQLHRFTGEVDKAAAAAHKVVATWQKLNNRPKQSEALMILAEIYFNQSKLDKTQAILSEVNALTKEDDRTLARSQYYNLRGLLDLYAANQQPSRLDDAQRMFERSASINEEVQHPGLRMANLANLAWVRFNKQDFEGAQKHFEATLAIAREEDSAPHIASSLVNLGVFVYLRDGVRSKASDYLKEAVTRMEEAGITADSANQNIEMLRQLEYQVSQESVDALPEDTLKMLLNIEGWEGLGFFLRMRSASLLTDEVDFILTATIAVTQRKRETALEKILYYYRSLLDRCRIEGVPSLQSIQHEPEATAVEYWWAYLSRRGRNYGAALTHINKVLNIDDADVDALIERGWIHRGLGRTEAAITDFKAVLKISKREPRAYQGKGVVCFELGRLNEAAGALTKAIELAPNDADSYRWRGTLYQAQEDFEAALKDLDRAIALAPQDSSPLYRRALAYLATEKFTEARRDLTQAATLDLDRENKSALAFDHFWRGVANDLLNDKEGARIDWRKGDAHRQTIMGRWSDPLYESTVCQNKNEDAVVIVEQHYCSLLESTYPWHILPAHIQHQKLLAKLYPERAAYPKAQEILEQALQSSSRKQADPLNAV